VVGPIARTVRDLSIALATIGGREVPAAGPPDAGDSGGLENLRIGWVEREG